MVEVNTNDGEAVRYVVFTAWECASCDVAGRTPPGASVECWNCGGSVVVTARPSVRHVIG
ncbi:MAG TPA: hypothetical protein VJT49_32805 [Amycolatopsis sp.]|uniref:hypothetical protein n=1 Tax=Amycolatopsis sp. TaxID=37632 RepID=UPI002B49DB10|nr:hypothetical protein [Amycolatopsis sp.]HKS49804.1 hypothetical protein [Amycolatopsis sp.]